MRRVIQTIVLLSVILFQFGFAFSVYADDGTHVVQKGETLFRISVKYNVTIDAIRRANGISGNTIYAGQTLIIPGLAGAPVTNPNPDPVSNPAPAPVSDGFHIIQRGETLFRISLKYGVTVAALQTANGIVGNTIYAGQRLKIPTAGDLAQPTPVPTEVPPASEPAPPPVEATPTPEPQPQPAPAGTGKRFLIDLSDQMLYAYEDDVMVRSTLISSGRWPTPTVLGTFNIYLKYTTQRMRGPGYDLPNVPYVMYFYQGYGLHGTYWHNNFGTPMSHGCVNMPTSEAEWAFNWAPIGTPVTVQQ
jgi:LysM repeat protein